MLPEPKDIRCCNRHPDYPTPVIGTTKFYKSEFWCPHCGAKYELFDGFKYYPIVYKLRLRKAFFEIISTKFLSSDDEAYAYYQRPDSFIVSWQDWEIAMTMFNLGYRKKITELVHGDIIFTVETHKMIKVLEVEGIMILENDEGKRKALLDLKHFDFAHLADPTYAADFLIDKIK